MTHPSGRPPSVASVDAWRGIAALMVVTYHTVFFALAGHYSDLSGEFVTHARWLAYGVQVFFVISGFCIAQTAVNQSIRPDSVARFALARLRRIYPPYFIVSILAVSLSGGAFILARYHLLPPSSLASAHLFDMPARDYICAAFLVQTSCHVRPFLSVFWTLTYEVAFYLIIGLVLLANTCSRKVDILQVSNMLSVATMMLILINPHMLPFPMDLWPQFGLGVLVYSLVSDVSISNACMFGIVLIGSFSVGRLEPLSYPYINALRSEQFMASGIFAVMLLLSIRNDIHLSRVPGFWWLCLLGDFSYSLYLTHQLTLSIVLQIGKQAGITTRYYLFLGAAEVLTSVALSYVFYMIAERPFSSKRQLVRLDKTLEATA